MKVRGEIRFSALLLIALGFNMALISSPGLAQSAAKDIVGTWSLVSAAAYGPNPIGQFTFDATGHFSSILMRSDLPKYASNNRTQGTPEEYKATVQGSNATFGAYSVAGTELRLHVVGSTFANWNDKDQVRTELFVTANEMRYIQPNPSAGW